ncbi:hypothetical protein HJ526_14785 [Donghicola sp. C2-DW-16]|uniref:DUF4352 domain-containing protein n=1 Tax=Donghicola mangrovi TaxID=2729614 RepID=A0ABX2PHX7_9RHOB|nr:hypothetical protein [Donghicola mangrovi]NVO28694.1 hypothetical protein [Donghicola mangrovi]
MGKLDVFEKIGNIVQSFVVALSAVAAASFYFLHDGNELRVKTTIEQVVSKSCTVHLVLGFENIGDRTWTAQSAKAVIRMPDFSRTISLNDEDNAAAIVASQTRAIDQEVKSGEAGAITLHLAPQKVSELLEYSATVALKVREEQNEWLRIEQALVQLDEDCLAQ